MKLHFGLAYGVPIDEACERMFTCARLLNAAAKKAPAASSHSFGEKIAEAIKAKVANIPQVQHHAAVFVSAEEESFGKKLKEAVKKKSGQERHKEQAERKRKRYPGYTRKRGKGE